MTMPNSASPLSSSASLRLVDKLLYIAVFGTFWFTVPVVAWLLYAWTTGIPLSPSSNSAFPCMLWGFILLISFKDWLGSYVPLVLALVAAVCIVLKYDHYSFHLLTSVVY